MYDSADVESLVNGEPSDGIPQCAAGRQLQGDEYSAVPAAGSSCSPAIAVGVCEVHVCQNGAFGICSRKLRAHDLGIG
jgi:hypothetical protein